MSVIFYPLYLPMANAIWLNARANAQIVLENQPVCGGSDQTKMDAVGNCWILT
jgi:hypothetical protein